MFSDVLWGSLADFELCPIVKEFILRSNGIGSSQLTFSCIAPNTDAQASARATANRIHRIFTLASESMSFSTSDYQLNEAEGSYSMILKVSPFRGL